MPLPELVFPTDPLPVDAAVSNAPKAFAKSTEETEVRPGACTAPDVGFDRMAAGLLHATAGIEV